MNMPRFTAEVSVYKSTRLYRGYSGRTRLGTASNVVAAASECEIACGVADAAALAICAALGFPLGIPCSIVAQAAAVACLASCQGGGGGGGGGGGCCPPGKRCCGSCASGKCDDFCVGPHQSCP